MTALYMSKLSKKITLLVVTILTVFLLPFVVFAEDTKVSDVIGETNPSTTKEIDEKEKGSLIEALSLQLPSITDNPSLIITFDDPSENKEGVQIDIDKKGFQAISSPFSFPALSIGSHFLRFKFVDKYGATQLIEKEFVVIPRPPILNTPVSSAEKITLSGSALAGSDLTLVLNSNQKMIIKNTSVDNDGVWSIEISENIPTGIYTFSAFTRKYGYSSNLAEPLTLDFSGDNSKIIDNTTQNIHFAFKDIRFNNLGSIITSNIDLVVLLTSLFLIGLIIGIAIISTTKKKKEEKEIKKVSTIIENQNNGGEKQMTLLEKLKEKTVNIENPIETPSTEESTSSEPDSKEDSRKEPEKIVTKIDFLKNFKSHDPDDDKGQEKEKKIKVSLTSK